VSVLTVSTSITIVAALLALGAGLAKLCSPHTAAVAMREVGVPSSDTVVRLGALAECAIAVAALVAPSWIARLALAISYGALTVFVAAALRIGTATDCGCFGAGGSTIRRRHLFLNAGLCVGVAATLPAHVGAIASSVRPGSPSGVAVLCVGMVSALLAATYVSHEGAS
jgi:hypothetical protein